MRKGWWRRTAAVTAFLVALGQPGWACTTMIITKGATEDGSTIVGHSDDNELSDQRIIYVPAMDHKPGAKRAVYCSAVAMGEFPEYKSFSYPRIVAKDRGPGYDTPGYPASIPLGEIPQVAHTYAYFDGSYGIMNEHQLMFGECTDGAKESPKPEPGKRLFYSAELARVALERCKTAREAVKLMGQLIDTYGYYGTGETLPVADPNEGWVFEMAPSPDGTGGLWVAKKVPDGEVFVAANEFRIRIVDKNDPDMIFSPFLFEKTTAAGWWKPEEGPFDWLKVVSLGEYNHPYYSLRRVWRLFSNMAPSLNLSPWVEDGYTTAYPFSVKPDKKLTIRDAMNLYRDHYEGTPFDLTKGVAAGPFGYPDRFYGPQDGHGDVGDPHRKKDGAWERPISVTYCGFVTLCQGRSWLPDPIGGLLWVGLDKPSETCFIPFYAGVKSLPKSFERCDTAKYERSSAWWAFNFVANWAGLKYSYMHKDVMDMQNRHESEALRFVQMVDEKALAIHNKKPEELGRYLTSVSESNAQKTVQAWWRFADELIVKYNDGYINEPGKMAQEVGYPNEWLQQTSWPTGPTTYKEPGK